MTNDIQNLRLSALAALDYDPESGSLTWRYRPELKGSWNSKHAGKPADNVSNSGYVRVRLNGRLFLAHRLIWLMLYGELPGQVDHINGRRTDNRIANLRAASHAENQRNRPAHKDCKSGFKGVVAHPGGKWRARIRIGGASRCLGLFSTPAEAAAAYQKAAEHAHGAFAWKGGAR